MTQMRDLLQDWWIERKGPKPGLPAAAYSDQTFFEEEGASVLSSGWSFVGFALSLPKTGDVQPLDLAGQPILLVRGAKGEVSAFHNVCRHRCLKLVEAPKNCGRVITCPYHAWAYGLDGKLRATPHFGGVDQHSVEGFKADENGLVPIRCHVWHDWIFVNLDGQAEPFEDYAAPLIGRLEGIDFEALVPVALLDFGEVQTNWKLLMENFIEPYHVQYVHASTTDQPLKDHATVVDGRCLGSLVDLPEEAGGTASLAVSSRYLTLFPNFILGRYFPDQLGVYLTLPVAPGVTLQKRAIYKTDGKPADEAEREGLKSLWWSVHKEDHAMCERQQLGRASPVAASGGLLSPHWEDSVRAFQDLIVEAIEKNT